nr:DUF2029 domain-containing protein [Ktedonobacterales bacterium]
MKREQRTSDGGAGEGWLIAGRHRLVTAAGGLALTVLAVVGLLSYRRILAVAGVFLSNPTLLLWPLVGATAVAIAASGIVFGTRGGSGQRAYWLELGLILAAGVAFRAIFLTAPLALSHDAYRYAWDAQLVAHGVSPYTHAVTDPALARLRDRSIWPNVNWRDVPTIYPPGAQILYLLMYRLAPLNIWGVKAVIEACDVGIAALMLVLLRRHGLDLRRVIVYWWSPIPVLEFASSAHVDAAAIFWTLGAVVVAGQHWKGARWVAGALLAMAALTKIYPLLFALVLLRRRDYGFMLGLGVMGGLISLPFMALGLGSGGFLGTYFTQRFIDQGLLL